MGWKMPHRSILPLVLLLTALPAAAIWEEGAIHLLLLVAAAIAGSGALLVDLRAKVLFKGKDYSYERRVARQPPALITDGLTKKAVRRLIRDQKYLLQGQQQQQLPPCRPHIGGLCRQRQRGVWAYLKAVLWGIVHQAADAFSYVKVAMLKKLIGKSDTTTTVDAQSTTGVKRTKTQRRHSSGVKPKSQAASNPQAPSDHTPLANQHQEPDRVQYGDVHGPELTGSIPTTSATIDVTVKDDQDAFDSKHTPGATVPRTDSAMEHYSNQPDVGDHHMPHSTPANKTDDAGSPAAPTPIVDTVFVQCLETYAATLLSEIELLSQQLAEKHMQVQQVNAALQLAKQGQVDAEAMALLQQLDAHVLKQIAPEVVDVSTPSQATMSPISCLSPPSSPISITNEAVIKPVEDMTYAADSARADTHAVDDVTSVMDIPITALHVTAVDIAAPVSPKLDQLVPQVPSSPSWAVGVTIDIELPKSSSELEQLGKQQDSSVTATAANNVVVGQTNTSAANALEVPSHFNASTEAKPVKVATTVATDMVTKATNAGSDVTDGTEAQPEIAAAPAQAAPAVDVPIAHPPVPRQRRVLVTVPNCSKGVILRPDIPAICIDDFVVGKPLGQGAQGIVAACKMPVISQQGVVMGYKAVAAKIAFDECDPSLMLELNIAQQFDHPNCLRVEAAITSAQNPLHLEGLAYEMMDGDLSAYMRFMGPSLTYFQRMLIIYDIALAVHYMHLCGYLHQDLKGPNTLLKGGPKGEPNAVKVGDFGLVCRTNHRTPNIGTFCYTAPEVLNDEEVRDAQGEVIKDQNGKTVYQNKEPITEQSDVYAVGAVMAEMMTGEAPWGYMPDEAIKYRKTNNALAMPETPPGETSLLSQQYYYLMTRCLQHDAQQRPTTIQILSYIQDVLAQHEASLQRAVQEQQQEQLLLNHAENLLED